MENYTKKYTREDVSNILGMCGTAENMDTSVTLPEKIAYKCRKSLAYRWYRFSLKKEEKAFLASLHGTGIGPEAESTLKKIGGDLVE